MSKTTLPTETISAVALSLQSILLDNDILRQNVISSVADALTENQIKIESVGDSVITLADYTNKISVWYIDDLQEDYDCFDVDFGSRSYNYSVNYKADNSATTPSVE